MFQCWKTVHFQMLIHFWTIYFQHILIFYVVLHIAQYVKLSKRLKINQDQVTDKKIYCYSSENNTIHKITDKTGEEKFKQKNQCSSFILIYSTYDTLTIDLIKKYPKRNSRACNQYDRIPSQYIE